MRKKRVVVIDVVGLSHEHIKNKENIPNIASLLAEGNIYKMRPVFPAVTLTAQASLTSGVYPETHGVVANGFYFPEDFHVAFWEQSSRLVQAQRIWDRLKKKDANLKTASIFFQNTLYANCDAIITPKPIHTEDGLIPWCYSKPVGLYEEICEQIGPFNIAHYWGPLASIESSKWISKASLEVMARIKPDLMFVYLPHLDYCSQKYGPQDQQIEVELAAVDKEVGRIVQGIKDMKMDGETLYILLSEYVFSDVERDIPINLMLREKGLLAVRTINNKEYIDLELSQAFAMVDHQVAHIYIQPGKKNIVRNAIEHINGIDFLLDSEGKRNHRIDHPRSGDLVAVSNRNRWFSYYWWNDRAKEPDFAKHVDIHRKPGYDPLELCLEPGTFEISQNTSLIHGSHGYPDISEQDKTMFIVSGAAAKEVDVSDRLSTIDVAGIIEKFLINNK